MQKDYSLCMCFNTKTTQCNKRGKVFLKGLKEDIYTENTKVRVREGVIVEEEVNGTVYGIWNLSTIQFSVIYILLQKYSITIFYPNTNLTKSANV